MPAQTVTKPKPGDIVRIEFLDHAQDSDDVLLFECFGRIEKITKQAIVVYHWRYVNDIDRAADHNTRHNEEKFAIAKGVIKNVRVLK